SCFYKFMMFLCVHIQIESLYTSQSLMMCEEWKTVSASSCLSHLVDKNLDKMSDGHICGPESNCTNTIGSYFCTCWKGYEGTDPTSPPMWKNPCIDIDECLDNICGDGGTCTNNPGSYVCDCHKGFLLSPDPTEINICIDATICGPVSNCSNSIGSHICTCFPGYREKNPEMIANIDECSETPSICGFQTVCTNKPGTFYCSCPDGFYPSTGLQWTVGVSFCKSELSMFVCLLLNLHYNHKTTGLFQEVGLVKNREYHTFIHSSLTANGNTMEINMGSLAENNNGEKFKSSQSCQRFVVLLTVSVMLTSPGSAAAAFLTLHGMESLLSHQYFKTENRTEMYSDVITAVLPSVNNTNLTEPVNFTLQHKKVSGKPEEAQGVDGCWVAYTTDNYTVCSCSHLSTFALIMQIGEVFQINDFLEWLNRMCVIVGLFFFALAILTFLLCSWNPKINNTARLHLCLSLSLSHLLLLWNEKYLACTVMAGILHFLVVASFVWMQLEAMQLYLLVRRLTKVQVIQRDGLPRPLLYVIGYGVPFVIVGVSALVYSDGYGATEAGVCWLSQKRNFNWALTGPVITILALNCMVFCATLWSLRTTLANMKSGVSQSTDTRLIVFKIVAQFFILGCTWILGLYQTNVFFRILFIILNSQQGTFLFIVHCLLNKEVREEYMKWLTCCCSKKREQRSVVSLYNKRYMCLTYLI
uniref:Adhesion G protein-coupled receptor E8 n=1 Tax=Sphaeramia orbicularis TaxID=375764 RepID=A0A672YI69_9TELE